MIDTLIISLKLKITYWMNSRLYAAKQIPGLKKLLSDSIYGWGWVKSLLMTLGVIREAITAFLYKFLYAGIMFVIPLFIAGYLNSDVFEGEPLTTYSSEELWRVVMQILLFLTLGGGVMNNDFFDGTMDKHYAINLLRFEPRKYTLSNYGYFLTRSFAGFLLLAFVACKIFDMPLWWALVIPIFVVSTKVLFAGLELLFFVFRRKRGLKKSTASTVVLSVTVVGALILSYGLLAMEWILPLKITLGIMLGIIGVGLAGSFGLIKFNRYREFCKERIQDFMETLGAMEKSTMVSAKKSIESGSLEEKSDKSGFEYLNELFIKRHRKILWKRTKLIALIALGFFALVSVLMIFPVIDGANIRDFLTSGLTFLPFLLYFINRGREFTVVLFMNCDHALFTYPVFKKPGHILHLFRLRLVEISKINAVPALVIGIGLSVLLFLAGGPDKLYYYPLIIITSVAVSIFFSVHYLILYYLLQPYNSATEVKSGLYSIIMGLTYLPCYMLVGKEIDFIVFVIAAIGFSVIYSCIALLLVYKLAPKTFKLRT